MPGEITVLLHRWKDANPTDGVHDEELQAKLVPLVYDHLRQEEMKKRSDTRKSLIGSGDRSERIRTYNFPQNRITDHRINFTLYKLDQVIAGDLAPMTKALLEYERDQLRGDMETSG